MQYSLFWQFVWYTVDMVQKQVEALCTSHEQFQHDQRVGRIVVALTAVKEDARRIANE